MLVHTKPQLPVGQFQCTWRYHGHAARCILPAWHTGAHKVHLVAHQEHFVEAFDDDSNVVVEELECPECGRAHEK